MEKRLIKNSIHPDYLYYFMLWEKYRYIMDGGVDFIEQYLYKYSDRESTTKFDERKKFTPVPGFASEAITNVKNAIFQRMVEITRAGGSELFRDVMAGKHGGVDLKGATMNYFIGNEILLELLFMGKVGVFVDMPNLLSRPLLSDQRNAHPYYYMYRAENIRNWRLSTDTEETEFDALLLREKVVTYDEFDLPAKDINLYRYLEKREDGVHVSFYNDKGELTDQFGKPSFEPIVLDIPRIPFVLFELNRSLLADIANHQIALLNLESSDISYALLANFPWYIEQVGKMNSQHLKGPDDGTGTEANSKDVNVGATTGRSYAQGLDPPQFIHPSPEPLMASIKKQQQLKDDIRTLIQLSLSSLQPKFASARSKEFDEKGLEAGLSYIGLVLEHGERQLAQIFSEYVSFDEDSTISYPTQYSLKSTTERIAEADELYKMMLKLPSKTAQKEIAKKIAKTLFESNIPQSTLEIITGEIDAAEYVTTDPETLYSDIEKGLVSVITASEARGYNAKKEVEKAKEEHAERIARIQASQTSGMQSRGVPDLDSETDSGTVEKANSQSADLQDDSRKATRK